MPGKERPHSAKTSILHADMLCVKRPLTTFLYLLLCSCIGKEAFAQTGSPPLQPGENQVCDLLTWYHTSLTEKDSQTVLTELARVERQFEKEKNHPLRRQAWLLQKVYKASNSEDTEQRANFMLQAASEASSKNWPLTQAECWHYTGFFYYHGGYYVKAFEYMQKAQAVFNRYISQQDYHYLHHYSNALAGCYYHFGEYREAIRYFRKTADLPSWWKKIVYAPALYNNLALAYRQLQHYDSAIVWYEKAYQDAADLNDEVYMALVQGNLGNAWFMQGQYEKALPLLESDFNGSMKAGETGSAVNAALNLAEIYLQKGDLEQAQKYIEHSRPFVYIDPHPLMLKSWYQNLYQLARAKGDYKTSSYYADSLLAWQDSVATMRDRKAFNQALLRLEAEKHLNVVNQLEHQRKQQVLLRNSLLIGLVLLALIALLLYNRQLLKRRKEKELAEERLSFAQRELINYTHQLKEKNELLEQLRDKLQQHDYRHDREGNLASLLEATILTEEDWKKFRQLFEKVYPGFFVRLKERIPDLSPADIRLLALTKLQLPPKNMAFMLGVTYDAVKKARQRLRKKINLPDESSLEELVEAITA